MSVSSKKLYKKYEEDLSKELEKSCKVSEETKILLEQKLHNSNEEPKINEDLKKAGNIIWSFWKIKKENIIFYNNNKQYTVSYNNIYTFYDTKNKIKNDLNNKIRENVIIAIVCNKIPFSWILYSWWYNIYYEIHDNLKKLCKIKFNLIKIEHKGGRNNNFDFLVKYYYKNEKVHFVKIEFKHNSKKNRKMPTIFKYVE